MMKLYELIDKKYIEPIIEYERTLSNWKNIPIEDCKEELVSLKDIDDKIIISPQYYINNIPGAENDCKVRTSIAEKLLRIAHRLPDGYCLLIWDTFRTIQTQQELFNGYYEIFKKETALVGDELINYTCKFVSLPSLDKTRPSPHNTGAVVDLTICTVDKTELLLGTKFDDFEEKAYTDFYEKKLVREGKLNDEDMEILLNRRILCNLFSEEGFVNYPYEIWHKSFGDQMWCELLNKDLAIYGSSELE